MNNYILKIQYDGTSYNGWQVQQNTTNTIQGLLQSALSIYLGCDIHLIGSGRTDSGVHAYAQIANFHYPGKINCNSFIHELNHLLPEDIRIRSCSKTYEGFHSRYNAVSKTYTYTICNDSCYDVFSRKYTYIVNDELNIDLMKKAANLFIGTHDFTNFTNANNNKCKVRTINSIKIQTEMRNHIKHIVISYNGDGFLYNMIRILTGTLIDVGLSKLSLDTVNNLLKDTHTRKRYLSGANIPPCGLCLKEIFFDATSK